VRQWQATEFPNSSQEYTAHPSRDSTTTREPSGKREKSWIVRQGLEPGTVQYLESDIAIETAQTAEPGGLVSNS
jgi:hypothetical protein